MFARPPAGGDPGVRWPTRRWPTRSPGTPDRVRYRPLFFTSCSLLLPGDRRKSPPGPATGVVLAPHGAARGGCSVRSRLRAPEQRADLGFPVPAVAAEG